MTGHPAFVVQAMGAAGAFWWAVGFLAGASVLLVTIKVVGALRRRRDPDADRPSPKTVELLRSQELLIGRQNELIGALQTAVETWRRRAHELRQPADEPPIQDADRDRAKNAGAATLLGQIKADLNEVVAASLTQADALDDVDQQLAGTHERLSQGFQGVRSPGVIEAFTQLTSAATRLAEARSQIVTAAERLTEYRDRL